MRRAVIQIDGIAIDLARVTSLVARTHRGLDVVDVRLADGSTVTLAGADAATIAWAVVTFSRPPTACPAVNEPGRARPPGRWRPR